MSPDQCHNQRSPSTSAAPSQRLFSQSQLRLKSANSMLWLYLANDAEFTFTASPDEEPLTPSIDGQTPLWAWVQQMLERITHPEVLSTVMMALCVIYNVHQVQL